MMRYTHHVILYPNKKIFIYSRAEETNTKSIGSNFVKISRGERDIKKRKKKKF